MKEKETETLLRTRRSPQVLLGIDKPDESSLIPLRPGARTCAVLATRPDAQHSYRETHDRVVVKLYKGNGHTSGSKEYQDYHENHFHKISALTGNEHVQQSITSGIKDGVGPYAIVQYVEGEELRPRLARANLTRMQTTLIMGEILEQIWIPLWDGKLRFKDCHAGNFVLTPDMKTVLIDTEQMRKDARELLTSPGTWTQRNKHQDSGLSRLPGLVNTIIEASLPTGSKAARLRQIKSSLERSGLTGRLIALGRPEGCVDSALQATEAFIKNLVQQGLAE